MGYNITSPSARQDLPARTSPYWKQIDPGFSIGYRKNQNTGTFFVRRFINGEYFIRRLGAADDNQEANGFDVLSYKQARKKASDHEDIIETVEVEKHPALFTVKDAVDDYLEWYRANKKAYESTKKVCDALIVPTLGSLPIAGLQKKRIDKWLQDLATSPPKTKNGYPKPPYAVRTDTGKRTKGKGRVIYEYTALPYDYAEMTLINCPACDKEVSPNATSCPNCDELIKWTADMKRKRKSTANRVLTVLKAALNHAWHNNENIASPDAWRKVKPFRDVDAPKVAHLTAQQARALLKVASDDFRPMAQAALLTGCRYGELSRLTVSDLDDGHLYIAHTKTGKSRHVPLSTEGLQFFSALAKGKQRHELLLTHEDGSAWDKSHQTRPMREACEAAGINPPVGFHVLRHTYATLLLRTEDNSPGVSISYVAEAIGDSVTTAKKHYGHVIKEDLQKEVARKLPSFGGAR